MRRLGPVTVLLSTLPVLLPEATAAQEREDGQRVAQQVAPYFRALGEHFRFPEGEVEVLAAWGLPPDHLPVVLSLARRSGGSPDALISQRRRGLSWAEVAHGLGLDASSFHVLLPEDAPLGDLAPAYERFAATPPARWPSIELSDSDIVHLVNIRFLGSALGVPPVRVLEVENRTGSFVAAYNQLLSPG